MTQEMRVDVSDGTSFLADEASVLHNPLKFVLDFKSVTPRIDLNQQTMRMKVLHQVVLLEPHLAKDFLQALKTNIDNYEKRFGKIQKPKSLEIAKKESMKQAKSVQATKKQDYFG